MTSTNDDEQSSSSISPPFSFSLYWSVLTILLTTCAGIVWQVRRFKLKGDVQTNGFKSLQKQFLIGYGFMVAADWMQGPFVYKLYSFYGYTKSEIGFLFVVGFLSSAVFGTIFGGLADRLGRRRMCEIYGIVYATSCATKHSTDYYVLVVGRILAGIASSILHSSFEAWIVHEHRREAYPEKWLSETLSLMAFSRGGIAILAAMIASHLASTIGYVAPFDMAAVFLFIGTVYIRKTWKENYGDQTTMLGRNFAVAWLVLASNPKVWLLGLIQASFEGAMYIFVFSWTPTLEASTDDDLPHGLVFACFMVAIMIGSHSFDLLISYMTNETVSSLAIGGSAITFFVAGISANHFFALACFVLYEAFVGLYYPSIGIQRARHIPSEVRATIMTLYRIPLNIIVVLALLNVSQMSILRISIYGSGMILVGLVAQQAVARIEANEVESRNDPQADDTSSSGAKAAAHSSPASTSAASAAPSTLSSKFPKSAKSTSSAKSTTSTKSTSSTKSTTSTKAIVTPKNELP